MPIFDNINWNAVSAISNILVAIATFLAVIVSLHLARQSRKPKASVKASFSYPVDYMNGLSTQPIYLTVEIVNQGLVPIYLNECTFKMGKNRMVFIDGSHNVNHLLKPGEFYSHKLDYQPIQAYLIQNNIPKLRTVVYFSDASGNLYKSKIKFYSS